MSVVGILGDDTDPMVSVMKVDKAPLESYADIGGLESQIQEIKEAVELPLTHPELVVGSELIQKYLGDGPKLVRELFRVADEVSISMRPAAYHALQAVLELLTVCNSSNSHSSALRAQYQ
eukprot:1794-Heterococcus_DN1.PRE.3